ncbi:hypothetical protein D3C77_562330 [compost metagenome]
MPMPVSVTCHSRLILASSWASTRVRNTTRPVSVNLMALLTRLLRIWRMRIGSPSRRSGRVASVQA